MKKKSFVLIAAFSSYSLCAQEVIATQGDSYTTASGSIDYTIGEVVIDTGTDGTFDITQGFHQTNWNFSGTVEYDLTFEALIFPNPTRDIVNINSPDFEGVNYELYDAKGSLVLKGNLTSALTPLDLSLLATGDYSITLKRSDAKLKTFKLIKLY